MSMRFTKMHGLGNDYVYVETFTQPAIPDEELSPLARAVADRHFGVGGDGLIMVMPPQESDIDATPAVHATMRMFNLDGSEGEMCGNGIRCVAKLIVDHSLGEYSADDVAAGTPLRIRTACGVLELDVTLDSHGKTQSVCVDMGAPILNARDVPFTPAEMVATSAPHTYEVVLEHESHHATLVSMGNPHAVIFVDRLDIPSHAQIGPQLEHHRAFPNRINVHFVQVLSADRVRVYHWERGSGPTLACGTGACAVAVAGALTGRTNRSITAELPGGPLDLRWDEETNHVFMTGPATEVFSGELDTSRLLEPAAVSA